jgi:hypothetical protein
MSITTVAGLNNLVPLRGWWEAEPDSPCHGEEILSHHPFKGFFVENNNKMSIIGVRHLDWMEFVWTSDLPSNAKLIAAYLSRFMNKNKDHAFPSLQTIEGETGLGHATVLKYLDYLADNQFITRQQGGGRNHVTYYHVRFPGYVDNAIKQVNSRPLSKINRSAGENKQVGSCEKTGREPTPNQQRINKESKEGRFTPPSLQEVSDYCHEKRLSVDPEQFVNFYEAKGWMIGKNKMKSWRHALATWQKRNGKKVEFFDPTEHYV